MDVIEGRAEGARDYHLERTIMLSDGVFAISITLLTLELKPPAGWRPSLQSLWMVMDAPLSAYAISFLVVAMYWNQHRRILARYARADARMILLNLLVLGLIGLMPPLTGMLYTPAWSEAVVDPYLILVAAIGASIAGLFAYGAFFAPGLMRSRLPLSYRWLSIAIDGLLPPAWTWLGFKVVRHNANSASNLAVLGVLLMASIALGRWRRRAGPEPPASG